MKPFEFCLEVYKKSLGFVFISFSSFLRVGPLSSFTYFSSSFLGNFSSCKYFNENKSFFCKFRWTLAVEQMKRSRLVSVQTKSENWLRVLKIICLWLTVSSYPKLSASSQRRKESANAIPHNFPKPNAPLDFTRLFRDCNIVNPKGFKLGRESFSRCKILI